MKDIIKQLYERKSIRDFEDREIDAESKKMIINAAFQAPTAGNQQMYTIIDVTSQEIKDKLVKSCDNQPFIAKAKMVLIFLADYQKWYDAFSSFDCKPRDVNYGDMVLAINDALIAAQNAVVAAESLGIGSCYIGDIMENYEYHKELFDLPEYVFPAAMLVFGYPTKQQKERIKPKRADEKYMLCENKYRRLDKDELQQMLDKNKGVREFEDWIKAFCGRKYNSDFSVEMSRSLKAFFDSL